jgi:hypothetical protein
VREHDDRRSSFEGARHLVSPAPQGVGDPRDAVDRFAVHYREIRVGEVCLARGYRVLDRLGDSADVHHDRLVVGDRWSVEDVVIVDQRIGQPMAERENAHVGL